MGSRWRLTRYQQIRIKIHHTQHHNYKKMGQHTQIDEPIYGSQLMTQQERNQYSDKMRAATTAQESARLLEEHHSAMMERAKTRGLPPPTEIVKGDVIAKTATGVGSAAGANAAAGVAPAGGSIRAGGGGMPGGMPPGGMGPGDGRARWQ